MIAKQGIAKTYPVVQSISQTFPGYTFASHIRTKSFLAGLTLYMVKDAPRSSSSVAQPHHAAAVPGSASPLRVQMLRGRRCGTLRGGGLGWGWRVVGDDRTENQIEHDMEDECFSV